MDFHSLNKKYLLINLASQIIAYLVKYVQIDVHVKKILQDKGLYRRCQRCMETEKFTHSHVKTKLQSLWGCHIL